MFCMNWCGEGGGDGGNGKNNIITTAPTTGDGRISMFGTQKSYRFHEVYTLGDKLGQGNFAIVKQATRNKVNTGDSDGTTNNNNHNESYAIKIVDRKKLTPIDEEALRDEIRIQKLLSSSQQRQHNNIVQLLLYSKNFGVV